MAPRKSKPEPSALKKVYDHHGYAANSALGLRMHLGHIIKDAPNLSKRVGLTNSDILTIRRIEAKLGKIRDHIYTGKEVN